MIGIFRDEEQADRENLAASYETYKALVEQFGCYVMGVSESVDRGRVAAEDIRKKIEYGTKVMIRLRELDGNIRQHNVAIDGSVEALLTEQRGYLDRLRELGAKVDVKQAASAPVSPQTQEASRNSPPTCSRQQ